MAKPSDKVGRVLRAAVTVLSALWGGVLLLVVVGRVGFPLELEWMEGGVLHQALRLQQGLPIYPPPSAEFVPFLYTPLYPVTLAGLGAVFPLGFALGRLVSVCSCVAIGWGLWRAVGREGKPRAHQAAAVGMFLSGYVFTFRWLDLARPDALYMALTLWGLVFLREAWGDHRKAVVAGVFIALGFWTKQTAATFIIASSVGALLVAPRQLWSYALTIAVVDGGGVLLGNAATDGMLWHYIYELHQAHAFNHERFNRKTWGMFVHAAPFLVAACLLVFAHFAAPWTSRRRTLDPRGEALRRQRLLSSRGLLYWGVMFATGLLVSALGYSTQWAEPNAFVPGVVFGALFIAVGLPMGGLREVAGLGLVAAQLVFAAVFEPTYQPIQNDGIKALGRSYRWQSWSRTVPTEAQSRAASELRAALERSPRGVFAFSRPWWSVLAGGPGHVGTMGITDLGEEDQARVRAELASSIGRGDYDELWFEGEPPTWLGAALKGFRVEERRHGPDRVRPMSGYMSEAGMVTPYRGDQIKLVPIARRDPPPGGRVIADLEDGSLRGFELSGAAFGGRAVRGKVGRLLAVGPYGGEYLLSSAGARGRLELIGTAESPVFVLPASGQVEFLVGSLGRRDGLSAAIVDAATGEAWPLPLPPTHFSLAPVRWEIPAQWGGRTARVRWVDDDVRGAIVADDLWIVAPD